MLTSTQPTPTSNQQAINPPLKESLNKILISNNMNLKELIKKGESENIEFKKSLQLKDEIGETVSAFSNSRGGKIIVGVDDKNKEVIGVEIGENTIENLANYIKRYTDSPVFPSIMVESTGGKEVIVVEVKEADEKPVLFKGRPYKRVGKSSHKASAGEVRKLVVESKKIYWDEQVCEDAALEDIDEEKVRWFLNERKIKRNVPKPEDMELKELLINIGAARRVDNEVKPTNAGILFFGKAPHKFFINSELRVAKFKGTDVTHPVLDRIDCRSTLWEMVRMAEEFIRRNIRLLSFRTATSFRRTDKFEYPIDALREAILNGLIHRNYSDPADVRVFLFDNRAEIINPGTFPEGVTPKNPVHKPINPRLCSLFYDIGLIEKYGSGIKLMNRLCRRWGNKEPHYDLHPLETKIIFESQVKETTYIEVADISDKLNERQKKALYFAQKKGFITRKEYLKINDIGATQSYKELKDLADKGFLISEGKGRAVKYVVPER